MALYDAFYRWCRDATRRDAQLAVQQAARHEMSRRAVVRAAITRPPSMRELARGAARLGCASRC